MRELEYETVTYTERGFLSALGLDDPDVAGIHALFLNGRWVMSPEKVERIDVVLMKVRQE